MSFLNMESEGILISPPQEKVSTIEDIYALLDGQRSELVDRQLYHMAPPNTRHQDIIFSLARKIVDYIDKGTDQYCFDDNVMVCIYEHLNIKISDLH